MAKRGKEDYIMEYLKARRITLSRAAVLEILENGVYGMCTEEAPISWYLEVLDVARKIGYCK